MTSEANSSNYFAVALNDDQQAIQSQEAVSLAPDEHEQLDITTSIRALRIAAAVERSKTEYKPEHAYTERLWLQPGSYKSQRPATNSQVDRQKLGTCDIGKCIAHETEYMASSLYFADPPDYQGALDLVLLKFDPSPKAKSLGGLSRELLDIGLKSAVKCGDKISAKNLADSSKSIWKGQFAGIAASAADAYMSAGLYQDAVKPLIMSMSAFGIHYPIAYRLSKALKAVQEERGGHLTATSYFQQLVDRAVEWRKQAFQRPIFSDGGGVTNSQGVKLDDDELAGQVLDTHAVALELCLDSEGEKALEGSWKRLSKGLDVDVQPEVSVREL
ncbi:hypothetical protein I307_06393 [Cryptococcus deuterogattii 99/473]|uniref:Uncharacterized protein n=1 Tax=Cryptococcus deuterogattii Ram5 TaxID=1296110 RepID=A0A0D0VBJ2_9TREE|nr:hypothetical protein I313_01383 [Cryptococcus deuterogattii Ram5]KIR73010.1 hypothetical protein I310_03618 [Cryptococcus deuterogattii CA1014]KIS00668.1 hypothetical protein L804_02088 [Cryptococcus deuterogattii 2001/935-1]KIY54286.1 hypothetical protein I307_06393 [Cryptococcus deuterogattii 99/473]